MAEETKKSGDSQPQPESTNDDKQAAIGKQAAHWDMYWLGNNIFPIDILLTKLIIFTI